MLPSGTAPAGSSAARAVQDTTRITLSTTALSFWGTGPGLAQQVTVTWSDGTPKRAGSSDTSIVTVTPGKQKATPSGGTFTSTVTITPLQSGTAIITFSDDGGNEYKQLFVSVQPQGTVWVSTSQQLSAYDAGASGSVSPRFTLPFPLLPTYSTIANIAANAAGNQLAIGVSQGLSPSTNNCYAKVYAVSGNSASYSSTPAGSASGKCAATAYFGATLLMLTDNPYNSANGQLTVLGNFDWYTLPYAVSLATDAAQAFVVTGPQQVSVFSTTAQLNRRGISPPTSPPDRIITFPAGTLGAIAVAPDGTLYAKRSVFTGSSLTPEEYIDQVRPGESAPCTCHTLGPFPHYDIAAMTTNSFGELYVAMNADNNTATTVRVYAPGMSGKPEPLRTLVNPNGGAALSGIAITTGAAPPPPPPPPAEEIYVGNYNAVEAYPIGANGNAVPMRTITGLGNTPNLAPQLGPIAVDSYGTLALVELGTTSLNSYDLLTTAPGASGPVEAVTAVRSETGLPRSVTFEGTRPAVLVNGQLDMFPPAPAIQTGVAPSSALNVPNGIAATTDAAGNIYVARSDAGSGGGIDVYAPGASGSAAPVKSLTYSGVSSLTADTAQAIAVAPDGTVYVEAELTYNRTDATFGVLAFSASSFGTAAAPVRTITIGSNAAGLAVDRAGEIFVGFGWQVSVYAPGASGNAAPVRVIMAPGTTTQYRVESLAIGP